MCRITISGRSASGNWIAYAVYATVSVKILVKQIIKYTYVYYFRLKGPVSQLLDDPHMFGWLFFVSLKSANLKLKHLFQ